MSSSVPQPSTPSQRDPYEGLVPYRRHIINGLAVLTGGFLVLQVWLIIRAGGFQAVWVRPVYIWSLLCTLCSGSFAAVGFLYKPDGKTTEAEKIRIMLLCTGGLLGMATALLGFVLPFTDYKEQLSGGFESWRRIPRRSCCRSWRWWAAWG